MENLTEKATFLERKSFTIDDKTLVVKFRLMGAEEENENKRVYPQPVLAKAVEELRAKLAKRKDSFALTTHKDDENVDDIAAVLEDVTMEGNDVFATARVLNSQRGRNVQAIIRGGGAVGVSAKCYGSVKDGRVQPGLVLRGFDFVTAPGFATYADKSNIIESCTIQEDDGTVTLAELEAYGLEPLEPVQEEILKRRYESACRLAGFRGSFSAYKKLMEKKQ